MSTTEKAQADIRASVMKYLNRGYRLEERVNDDGTEVAIVEFQRGEIVVRIQADVELPDQMELSSTARRARTRTKEQIEQEMRELNRAETWTAIAGSVKARLIAVDRKVSTFEQAFMADIVTGSGETFFEAAQSNGMIPQLTA